MAEPGVDFGEARDHVLIVPNNLDQFVWLWTWCRDHIGACENALTSAGFSMARVDPQRLGPLVEVGTGHGGLVRDLLAHLCWLDEQIGRVDQHELLAQSSVGFDGQRYRVLRAGRAAMAPVSRRRSLATLGGSVRSYVRHHVCTPVSTPIVASLLSAPLRDALTRSAEDGRLRVLPLDTGLAAVRGPHWTITVDDRAAANRSVETAIRSCADDAVAILLLPELAVPSGALDGDNGTRAGVDSDHPVLVVAGVEHHQDSDGAWRNLAVVVDRYGNVVHTHHKVTRVNSPDGSWEIHETGVDLALVPSPIGLIATPICRDLFHPDSPASPATNDATLVLCPSLSPKTDDHLDAAKFCGLRTGAVTAVANRWGLNGEPMHPDAGASFVLRPGYQPDEVVKGDATGAPIDITW